jgi:hypothetical protein
MSTPETALQDLREVRRGMLRLHKILLDQERASYEKTHGPVTSGELLQLVINHEQFAWLHAISELIVRIDERFDEEAPLTEDDAKTLLRATRTLLIEGESEDSFKQKYYTALQLNPTAVLAHKEVTAILSNVSSK